MGTELTAAELREMDRLAKRQREDEVEEIREWVKQYGIGARLSAWLDANGEIGKLGSTWKMAGAIVHRGLKESFWEAALGDVPKY